MLRVVCTALAAATLAGCYDDGFSGSPASPSVLQRGTLEGVVSSLGTSEALEGATITVLSGGSAGRTATTSSAGSYSMSELAAGLAIVQASAPGHKPWTSAINITLETTANFTLRTLWTASGIGDAELTKPLNATVLHITGTYARGSSTFVVWCGNQLVVRQLLGTDAKETHYARMHGTENCAQVRIETSADVEWTFAEQP